MSEAWDWADVAAIGVMARMWPGEPLANFTICRTMREAIAAGIRYGYAIREPQSVVYLAAGQASIPPVQRVPLVLSTTLAYGTRIMLTCVADAEDQHVATYLSDMERKAIRELFYNGAPYVEVLGRRERI